MAWAATLLLGAALTASTMPATESAAAGDSPPIPAGSVLRISVPEAVGGKTVIGQLTIARATGPGYVTAYGCDDGIPTDPALGISRSDLNYDGRISREASNRLIVKADDDGDVCFYTVGAVDLIIDVNAVSFDNGIESFPNQRTDTRTGSSPRVAAGGVLRVTVPQAVGGKTVVGQLTVARASGPGFVTAYGCDDGIPFDAGRGITRSDLNYDGRISPVWSNRLIVQADADGDVCFYTVGAVDLVIDVNGASGNGIESFSNQRTDTRSGNSPRVAAGGVLRVPVPQAIGRQTVVGQLTVANASGPGYVTAYGCDDGIPTDPGQGISRSDLNYDGRISPVWSNRLIVQADRDGDVCFYTVGPVDLVIDVNAVSDTGISSFPNQRTDTRTGRAQPITSLPATASGVPVWPSFEPAPAMIGVAALTGEPANGTVASRPIVAVKIDNFRLARPQWGLELADAVIEENVEGVTRFIALFQTQVPVEVGPVRSARTADLDLLAAMNRPIFAYSGANPGVTDWITSAAASGVLVDFTALRNPCYGRSLLKPGPHNLLLDHQCVRDRASSAGAARPLWSIDPAWTVPTGVTAALDTTFRVRMDGVRVEWTWDEATGRYLRSQDGADHVTMSGERVSARNVVEVFSEHIPSPVDGRSPNPITVGTGAGIVHRNGRAIAVTWSRATPFDSFTFREVTTGAEVPLDRGVTFLELVRDR